MYRFVSLENFAIDRPCHGKVNMDYFDENEWDTEKMEQLARMLSQHKEPYPWLTITQIEERLQTDGIEFVKNLLKKTGQLPAHVRARRRTLHMFQEMFTQVAHIVNELVVAGVMEKQN